MLENIFGRRIKLARLDFLMLLELFPADLHCILQNKQTNTLFIWRHLQLKKPITQKICSESAVNVLVTDLPLQSKLDI